MTDFGFNGADLQQLHILKVLLEERHVSRTAERMGMTQSSVSKALARLREQFSDALLIRAKGGYQLTHKARNLEPQLHDVLGQVDRLFAQSDNDPTEYEAEIRIAIADDLAVMGLPKLIGLLQERAPKLKLSVRGMGSSVFEDLKTGRLDLLVEDAPQKGTGLYTKSIVQWSWCCVMGKTHPAAKEDLTLEAYLKAKHGLVSFSGDRFGIVDEVLGGMGLQRDVVLTVPSFSTLPFVIERNQILFAVPKVFGQQLASHFDLIIKDLPFDLQPLNIAVIWHHRNQYDSIHSWFRDLLIRENVFSSL